MGLFTNQFGLGLGDLLIEVWSIDFGQHLANFYPCTDIDSPVTQEPADARIDLRLSIGLEAARQLKEFSAGAGAGLHRLHKWRRLCFGTLYELRIGQPSSCDTRHPEGRRSAQRKDREKSGTWYRAR